MIESTMTPKKMRSTSNSRDSMAVQVAISNKKIPKHKRPKYHSFIKESPFSMIDSKLNQKKLNIKG